MSKRTTFFKSVAATLALAFVAVLGLPLVSRAQGPFAYFWWQVTDEFGVPYTAENVFCSVYKRGTGELQTLHLTTKLNTAISTNVQNTGQGTDATPPNQLISDVNGRLHFYTSGSYPTADTVGVNCFYAGGGSAHIDKLSQSFHKLVIPRQSGVRQVSRFAYAPNTGQNASGITLPEGALIRDVIVQNMMMDTRTGILGTTGATTLHLNVGFGGNHAVSTWIALVQTLALTSDLSGAVGGSGGTNATGPWIRAHMVTNVGTLGSVLAANHRGTALSQYHQSVCFGGVCSATTTGGGMSLYREVPYLIHMSGGLDVTYNTSGCGGGSTNAFCPHGYVYILWDRLHLGLGRSGDAVNTSGTGPVGAQTPGSGIY